MKVVIALVLLGIIQISVGSSYPVATPSHGRQAVHGWLILPIEQDLPNWQDTATPVDAWYSHHTPEFFFDSPHDFQIIVRGTLTPLPFAMNETLPIKMPYPPATELIGNEYTFTPPPPFSLNDLLNGDITILQGTVYNGSFDTSYERIPINIARFDINELTTTVWLNYSSSVVPYEYLTYYSYPRAVTWNNNVDQYYYLSHTIHAAPDFNSIVQAKVDLTSCSCINNDNSCPSSEEEWYNEISNGGKVWIFENIPNLIQYRLYPTTTNSEVIGLTNDNSMMCKFQILEEIHCVVGPAFGTPCTPL